MRYRYARGADALFRKSVILAAVGPSRSIVVKYFQRPQWAIHIQLLLYRMAPVGTTLHLPNGQTVTVSPVFGGYSFKANDLNVHQSVFPPGWSIIINTKESEEEDHEPLTEKEKVFGSSKHATLKFSRPTLNRATLYLSTISNPSSIDFKPAASPTRQIAMMLWITLWWYFHLVSLSSATDPSPTDRIAAGARSTS